MTDLLGTGIGVTDLGAAGVVILLVLMLFTDRLITKGRHDEQVAAVNAAHDKQLEQIAKAHATALAQEKQRADDAERRETKAWEVADAHDARADVLAAQVAQLTGGMGTVVDVLAALRTLAERNATTSGGATSGT